MKPRLEQLGEVTSNSAPNVILREDTKLRHSGIEVISIRAINGGFNIDEEVRMKYIELFFVGFLRNSAYCEDLDYGGLTRSEAALIRTNQFVNDGRNSLT